MSAPRDPMGALCVDDFGEQVFRCRHTDALTWASRSVIVGSTIPGVHARYVAADTDGARAAGRAAVRAFHESEGNCNTCRYLRRVPTPKSRTDF